VWYVHKLPSHEPMVMKIMDKTQIYRKRAVDTVFNEMKLMSELMHPFILSLKYAFQEKHTLYLVSEYMSGGDLCYFLNY